MTIRRMAIGMVDTERTCLTCALPAPATPAQVEWPARAADLRREAATLEAKAKAMRAEAARVDGMVKEAVFPAFLCSDCRQHLHDPNLSTAWLGGLHDASDGQLIERTVDYLQVHQPDAVGTCSVCRRGATREEPIQH